MAATLQPYPAYNLVAYDYVNSLPDGWKLLPNIAIFEERIERGHDGEELLSVTIKRGVIKQTEVEIKKDNSNEDKSKYKLVKVGDIAYNKMRMWQGALGYSAYQGIASPAYVILKPKMELNPRYFHYMFRTGFYTNYSKRFSYGIVDDQLSLRYTDFKRMYSIVPPLSIQNVIVDYLDEKCEEIDRFIKNKERLIKTLNDQKETVIANKVTAGLIHKIEFNATDEVWENKIPMNWSFKPLKHFVVANKLALSEKTNPEYELKYIDIGNVNFEGLVNEPELLKFANAPSRARRIVKSGDTILSTVRTYLRAIAFFKEAEENLIASTGFAVLTPKKNIHPEYLKFLLSSTYFVNKVSFWSIGVNYPSINNDRLLAIKVSVPNTLDDQMKIISELKEELHQTNDLINKAQREIEKITEFREALINKIICGKLSPFATN